MPWDVEQEVVYQRNPRHTLAPLSSLRSLNSSRSLLSTTRLPVSFISYKPPAASHGEEQIKRNLDTSPSQLTLRRSSLPPQRFHHDGSPTQLSTTSDKCRCCLFPSFHQSYLSPDAQPPASQLSRCRDPLAGPKHPAQPSGNSQRLILPQGFWISNDSPQLDM